jgi:hypothetical protein
MAIDFFCLGVVAAELVISLHIRGRPGCGEHCLSPPTERPPAATTAPGGTACGPHRDGRPAVAVTNLLRTAAGREVAFGTAVVIATSSGERAAPSCL